MIPSWMHGHSWISFRLSIILLVGMRLEMISTIYYIWASPVAQRVKKPPAMEETQEAWVLPVGWEDPLEEGMATLPIFLPGGISWLEEPGRLQFIGLQRIRHD